MRKLGKNSIPDFINIFAPVYTVSTVAGDVMMATIMWKISLKIFIGSSCRIIAGH